LRPNQATTHSDPAIIPTPVAGDQAVSLGVVTRGDALGAEGFVAYAILGQHEP